MSGVRVVWAREPIPTVGPTVFLAGPTPRRGEFPSWRKHAIELITDVWAGAGGLTVLTPESRGGVRAESYEDQFVWETGARQSATVILFWIPRDVEAMPGFTTNVEFGYDVGAGRGVVLGCPDECPNPERNRYLVHLARWCGVPVRSSLVGTVSAAVARVGDGA